MLNAIGKQDFNVKKQENLSFGNQQAAQANIPQTPADSFVGDVKTAKTASVIAALTGTASLVVSLLIARKAGKAEAAIAPIVKDIQSFSETGKKILAPVNKFIQDTGLGAIITKGGELTGDFLNHAAEAIKKLAIKSEAIAKETDPAKITGLNNELNEEIGNVVLGYLKSADTKLAAAPESIIDSPIGKLVKAFTSDKVKLPADMPESLSKGLLELLTNGQAVKNPAVKAVIEQNPDLKGKIEAVVADLKAPASAVAEAPAVRPEVPTITIPAPPPTV